MKNQIIVECFTCKTQFGKSPRTYRWNKKINPDCIFYCSRKCFHSNRRKSNKPEQDISVTCNYCSKSFLKYASQQRVTNNCLNFCNSICTAKYREEHVEKQELFCELCGTSFLRTLSRIKRYSRLPNYNRHYCSRTCARKSNGLGRFTCLPQQIRKRRTRSRSLLELFIEKQIQLEFPNLPLICCGKYKLFELDFYFPSLLLAIEINGPTHYSPIYGNKVLTNVQNRDLLRSELCKSRNVKLEIIPVMSDTRPITKRNNYWNTIKDIIFLRISENIEIKSEDGFKQSETKVSDLELKKFLPV